MKGFESWDWQWKEVWFDVVWEQAFRKGWGGCQGQAFAMDDCIGFLCCLLNGLSDLENA
jgi:hypothetical protein